MKITIEFNTNEPGEDQEHRLTMAAEDMHSVIFNLDQTLRNSIKCEFYKDKTLSSETTEVLQGIRDELTGEIVDRGLTPFFT
jgi:hypothetical protein